MTLDTYVVSERGGEGLGGWPRQDEVRRALLAALRDPRPPRAPASRRAGAGRLRHFDISAEVRFHPDDGKGRSVVEVVAPDRPGLLACIGIAFADCDVRLQNAKIATYGERAEDVFFVTERGNRPLDAQAKEKLRRRLLAAISVPLRGRRRILTPSTRRRFTLAEPVLHDLTCTVSGGFPIIKGMTAGDDRRRPRHSRGSL